MNILKACDYLSPELTFKQDGSRRLKSICGGTFSLLMVVLFGALFGYLSRDIFLRENPITRVDLEETEDRAFKLKSNPIVLNFLGTRGVNYNNPLREHGLVRGYVVETPRSGGIGGYKAILVTECTEELLGSSYTTLEPYLRDSYCIDPSKSMKKGSLMEDDIEFYGSTFAAGSSSLTIRLEKKLDDKESLAFFEKSERFFAEVVTTNQIVMFRDYDNPVKQQVMTKTVTLTSNTETTAYMNFTFSQITTDSGLFFSSMDTKDLIEFNSLSKDVRILREIDESVMNLHFEAEVISKAYYREYTKIPSVLAQLGGIAKVILIVGEFIMKYYSDFSIYKELVALKQTSAIAQVNDSLAELNTVKAKKIEKLGFWSYLKSVKLGFGRKSSNLPSRNEVMSCFEVKKYYEVYSYVDQLSPQQPNVSRRRSSFRVQPIK